MPISPYVMQQNAGPKRLSRMKKIALVIATLLACLGPGPSAGAAAFGNRILFQAGSSIFSVQPNGEGYRKLVSGDTPFSAVWSPDKDKIAFTRSVNNLLSVWVMDSDGTDERRVADGGGAVWSPDGSRLAFVRPTTSDVDPLASRDQLFTINVDGSDERLIADAPERSMGDLDWSPDGSRIAFVAILSADDGNPVTSDEDNWDIYSVRLDTGTVLQLTEDLNQDEDPQWSPDGKRIAFVSDRDDELCGPGGGCPYATEIYLMRSDGSNEVRFTKNASRHDRNYEWSPDGRAIAWSQTVDDDVNSGCCQANILVKALDGSPSRQLTDDRRRIHLDPSWSPDGRWLVYISWRDGSLPDLFKIRRDGTSRARITRTARSEGAPDW